jgi:Flp pilus assembly CpaF family ATPase
MNTVDMDKLFAVVKPIEFLLQDPAVTEIMIDNYQRVLVERGGALEQVKSPFANPEALERMIIALFELHGITLSAAQPVGELRFPDHSRCLAVMPPAAADGPYLVLRKIANPHITWDRIIEHGAITPEARAMLEQAVASRRNILISGGTGSGKTTIARLMTELIPPEERVIVAESIYELDAHHPRLLHLEAGGPGKLSFQDVLTTASRMRPDRLIVGNLEGPESLLALQLFSSGYDGGMTHIHANSVEDALARLEAMCLTGSLGLGLEEIRRLIASAIHLIIHSERLPNGDRRMTEISELLGVENHRYVLKPLMRYNNDSDRITLTEIRPTFA